MDNEETITYNTSSPTEFIKQKSVSLLFDCIDLNARSIHEEEKYAFIKKAKDLSIMLERYTPRQRRKELKDWLKQLDNEIKEIKENYKQRNATPKEMEKAIMEKKYEYMVQVHEHNQRVLMTSPIIELEVTGEMDITSEEMVEMVRGGKRTDDGKLVSK